MTLISTKVGRYETQLTTELIKSFQGGQIEVQNQAEGHVYRGEIATGSVDDGTLNVSLNWMAKAPFPPTSWTKDGKDSYSVDLELYGVSDIGPSPEGGDSRIMMQSSVTGEAVVFYPANGSRLDISLVKGMD